MESGTITSAAGLVNLVLSQMCYSTGNTVSFEQILNGNRIKYSAAALAKKPLADLISIAQNTKMRYIIKTKKEKDVSS